MLNSFINELLYKCDIFKIIYNFVCYPEDHHCVTKSVNTVWISVTRFTKLTRAKEILCNTESRAKYDNWRRSGIAMSYSDWCNMKGAVHTVCNPSSSSITF